MDLASLGLIWQCLFEVYGHALWTTIVDFAQKPLHIGLKVQGDKSTDLCSITLKKTQFSAIYVAIKGDYDGFSLSPKLLYYCLENAQWDKSIFLFKTKQLYKILET